MKNLFLGLSLICLAAASSQAAITFTSDPTSGSASTSFGGDVATWGPQNLYDGSVTPADIGTNIAAGIAGADYAGLGFGPHVLVYDFGAPITFDGVAYAQRNGNGGLGPNTDRVFNIDVWVTSINPGVASVGLPGTLGAPMANTGLLDQTQNARNFNNYDLGTTLTGQYVVLQLNDAGDTSAFNPGGSELRLTIPEPSSAILGLLGFFLIFRRRRG